MKRIALEHIAELEYKTHELRAMTETLRHLADHCYGDDRPEYPILEELAEANEIDTAPAGSPRLGRSGIHPLREKRNARR